MIYGKAAVILLNEIASEKPGSANAAIAKWLLQNPDQAENMSIKAVAEGAHVGIASVSRFVQDIGFADFSSLKEMLKEGLDRPAQVQKDEDERVIIRRQIVSGLDLAAHVDMHAIRQCAKAIDHYQKIWVFGLMKAEAAAMSLADDLCLAGKDAATLFSHGQQTACIKRAGPDELIILFSYTGSYFDINEEESRTMKISAPVVMISGGKNMYPHLTSLFIQYPCHLDHASHPYTLLYLADLIFQTYLSNH